MRGSWLLVQELFAKLGVRLSLEEEQSRMFFHIQTPLQLLSGVVCAALGERAIAPQSRWSFVRRASGACSSLYQRRGRISAPA